MSRRVSRIGWIALAVLLCLSLVVLPACGGGQQEEEEEEEEKYLLTIATTPGGSTTPIPGTRSYVEGTDVSIVASADAGYVFAGWTGETSTIANVNDPSTTITMNGDYSITANFEEGTVPTSTLGNVQGYPTPGLTPQYGGTLIILHDSAPSNIGAFWMGAGGWDSPQSRPALEKLCGLGEDFQPCAQLATDWEVDEGAMTITFTLREGVKFHDGTDFNAAAVEWNLEHYRDYGEQHQLDAMTDAVPNGDYEIELQFDEWNPNIMRDFFGSAGIMVSPTHVQAVGDGAQWHPVGTGPYKFVEYVDDVKLVYEAFDDYWQEGLPYLDGVEIHYVSDDVTRILAFRNEDGHVMNQMSTTYALTLKAEGYNVEQRLVHIKGIVPDSKSAPFDNQEIREALAYCFDYTTEVTEIFDGQWTPTGQCAMPEWTGWNPDMVGYPWEAPETGWGQPPGRPGLEIAQELMANNGYGPTNMLETTLHYSTSECTSFYTVWKEYLADAYFDVTLHFMTRGPYMGMSGGGWNGILEFQFSYNGMELLYDQSLMMGLSPDASRNADIDYPQEYIDLYEAMLLEDDPATRETMYQQLNTMMIDEYCLVMPHFGYEVFSARQPYVHDWGYGVMASEFCPEYVWMNP